MRKTKLLVSALSVAAILPLSSCGLERTNANDFQGTYEMYRAFFEKTYEYDNMKVVMDLGGGRFRTEYICASTSHSVDSDTHRDTWAYLNKDGWKTVAYQYTPSAPATQEHWYKYNANDYQTEYKSYIKYINFLDVCKYELEHDSEGLMQHWFENTEFDTRKEDLGDGKSRLTVKGAYYEYGTDEKSSVDFVAEAENGLVKKIIYKTSETSDYDDDLKIVSNVLVTISYGGVKSIELPDITGWEER